MGQSHLEAAQIEYKGYQIDIEKGPWGWSFVVFRDGEWIAEGQDYIKRKIALLEAEYMVDEDLENPS